MTALAWLFLTFRALQSGSYGNLTPAGPEMIVVRDAAALQRLWQSGAPPHIDFKKEWVVFLFAGEKRTGGHLVHAKSVKRKGKTIIVEAQLVAPKAEGVVTQVLTSPYAVIAVPCAKATRVRWTDRGRVVAEEPEK